MKWDTLAEAALDKESALLGTLAHGVLIIVAFIARIRPKHLQPRLLANRKRRHGAQHCKRRLWI